MGQRDILEEALGLDNQLAGPAKLLYSDFTLPMPIVAEEVIDPTSGGAASGWTPFGITRGGINFTKSITKQVMDDIDQIIGEYDQRTTTKGYTVSTQIGEVLDEAQVGVPMEEGTPTVVSTDGPTQVMIPLDSANNEAPARHIAIVYPKPETGKVTVLVLRNAKPASGDRTWRFDKTDKVSPAFEFRAFPVIASDIPVEQRWGVRFDIK